METPSIPIRRSPIPAVATLAVGIVVASLGLLYGEFWIVFLGILPVLIAAMLMLNPMVVLTDDSVELKNIFGLTQASYAHDGIHLIVLENDVIFIQKGDMRAPLKRIVKGRMHAGDWRVMLETMAHVRQLRKQEGKSKGTA